MAHVDLSPRYERFIRDQLESGRFSSASEVVEEALRLMSEHAAVADEDPPGLDVEWMREKIRESLDDPRPPIPADQVFEKLEAKHAARMKLRK